MPVTGQTALATQHAVISKAPMPSSSCWHWSSFSPICFQSVTRLIGILAPSLSYSTEWLFHSFPACQTLTQPPAITLSMEALAFYCTEKTWVMKRFRSMNLLTSAPYTLPCLLLWWVSCLLQFKCKPSIQAEVGFLGSQGSLNFRDLHLPGLYQCWRFLEVADVWDGGYNQAHFYGSLSSKSPRTWFSRWVGNISGIVGCHHRVDGCHWHLVGTCQRVW